MKIDYIIKSHNELPYLANMLWSLKYNNPAMWDSSSIYIFANDCDDGTKQWCDRNNLWCKEVNLPGLYSIWNHAAEITAGELIVFSASDFFLAPGFWNKLLKAYLLFKQQFYHFTGSCIDNGISYPHADEIDRRWFKRNCGDNWHEFSEQKFYDAIKNIASIGITENETQYCPFLTTREHFSKLQGFNILLGDYPTDIDHDFVRRGKEIGRECCIVNNAFFYHFGKKSLLRRDNIQYDWHEIINI